MVVKDTEHVQLYELEKDEFILPKEQRVAYYDADALAKDWNDQKYRKVNKKPNVFVRVWSAWKRGIWGSALWVVLFYLLAYYVVNIVLIQYLCAREYADQYTIVAQGQQLLIDALGQSQSCDGDVTTPAPGNGTVTPAPDPDRMSFDERRVQLGLNTKGLEYQYSICLNYEMKFGGLSKQEAGYTRLLTFLIGFYVSFTINRWWTQVTSVPTIDGICLALEGYLWCNEDKNEDEIYVKEGVTVTQFKQTIARYCLLSWTMCLSLISPTLLEKMKKPSDFNKKLLMTFNEYKKLETTNQTSLDGWKVKWTVPLLWVNSMLNDAETLNPAKDGQDFKVKELKEILKATTEFQLKLYKVFQFNDNQIPDLILSAVKLGVWFWLVLGIFSSQGLVNRESNIAIPIALLLNFPVLHIIKYVVMFGWMKAATYLQNPFGDDE